MRTEIAITTAFIKLDALLKFAGLTMTGGEAKELVQSGEVLVDGGVCTQRGRKITPGMEVTVGEQTLVVTAAT
ncbi:RNA-binding S4 domain-containing protein [Feifania hominis]|uniref:RNA-binding S4 domain-containing protein n=1 Tax=Feifania hominis TaxID=2763660 RepID=A0A926DD85_9FIRM|nr:RNA-binding S4 domain-containing protein [Feifania hominis]MBC8536468.1 RNA-binding S4 domain-containing protein [Feifania hominis]